LIDNFNCHACRRWYPDRFCRVEACAFDGAALTYLTVGAGDDDAARDCEIDTVGHGTLRPARLLAPWPGSSTWLPGPGFLRGGGLLVDGFGVELAGECVQALVGPPDPAVAQRAPGHGFPCRG
jgi:hypothetical protein